MSRMGDAVDYVFSSKTLTFIFVMTAMLLAAFVVATVAVNFGAELPVTSDEVIDAWKWATGAGTTRNILSDGVMPRVAQAVGAAKDPSVATQAPVSMRHAEPPAVVAEYYTPLEVNQ